MLAKILIFAMYLGVNMGENIEAHELVQDLIPDVEDMIEQALEERREAIIRINGVGPELYVQG